METELKFDKNQFVYIIENNLPKRLHVSQIQNIQLMRNGEFHITCKHCITFNLLKCRTEEDFIERIEDYNKDSIETLIKVSNEKDIIPIDNIDILKEKFTKLFNKAIKQIEANIKTLVLQKVIPKREWMNDKLYIGDIITIIQNRNIDKNGNLDTTKLYNYILIKGPISLIKKISDGTFVKLNNSIIFPLNTDSRVVFFDNYTQEVLLDEIEIVTQENYMKVIENEIRKIEQKQDLLNKMFKIISTEIVKKNIKDF